MRMSAAACRKTEGRALGIEGGELLAVVGYGKSKICSGTRLYYKFYYLFSHIEYVTN